MMELFGTSSCEECNIIKQLLQKTPLEWRYNDVSLIQDYTGNIPLLIDGNKRIYGLFQIENHINKTLEQMGFIGGIP